MSKKKYVEVYDLLKHLPDEPYKGAIRRVLQQAPAADVVEVVRCCDCIGKKTWYKNDYGVTICGLSGLYVVEDNDFCSYGDRGKEDEAD